MEGQDARLRRLARFGTIYLSTYGQVRLQVDRQFCAWLSVASSLLQGYVPPKS